MNLMQAVAALGAGLGGYAKGRQIYLENQRREKDQKWQDEQRERQRQQWEEEDRLKADIRDAAAPVQVEQPWQPAVDDEGNPMPQAPAYRAGMRRYGTLDEAQKAAEAANTPQAQMQRIAQAYRRAGRVKDAVELETAARQGQLGDLQLGAAKEAAARDKALREMGSLLARGGWQAVPQVYARYDDGMSATVQEDGKGGAIVTRFGPDGKPAGQRHFKDIFQFFEFSAAGFDPKLWIEGERTRAQRAEDTRRWEAEHELSKQRVGLERERLGIERAKAAENLDLKLPPAVRAAYQTLQAKVKTINDAIVKAQADGTWNPDSPGARELMTELTASTLRMEQMLAPYLKEAGVTTEDDPLGLFAGQGNAAAQGSTAPAAAPAADAAQRAPAPAAAPAPAPARRPAPPGSPQARWEERQASMRAERERAIAQAQAEFAAAAQSLSPLELLRKYPDLASRRALSREQLALLREIEQSVR